MKICNDKYTASTDDSNRIVITGKDKGFIESQSVEAILLFEIVNLLKKILDRQK